MLNLLIPQLFNMLKANGFDPEKAQSQIAECVGDIRAMRDSQERCEKMLRDLCDENVELDGAFYNVPPKNITVTDKVVLGKPAP